MSKVVGILNAESDQVMQDYVHDAYRAFGDQFSENVLVMDMEDARVHAISLQPEKFEVSSKWLQNKYPMLDRYVLELARRQMAQMLKK